MYAPQRHRAILEQVISYGHASVQVLADSLDVTPETIRRDLTELHQQGLLRRVHGGAMPLTRLGFEPSVVSRSKLMLEEKERIDSSKETGFFRNYNTPRLEEERRCFHQRRTRHDLWPAKKFRDSLAG